MLGAWRPDVFIRRSFTCRVELICNTCNMFVIITRHPAQCETTYILAGNYNARSRDLGASAAHEKNVAFVSLDRRLNPVDHPRTARRLQLTRKPPLLPPRRTASGIACATGNSSRTEEARRSAISHAIRSLEEDVAAQWIPARRKSLLPSVLHAGCKIRDVV